MVYVKAPPFTHEQIQLATRNVTWYNSGMIRNIRHKGLEALHNDNQTKGVQQAHVKRLRQILAVLDTANTLDDIDLPGLRLHPLKGPLAGFHAVTVSGKWRVVFRFETGDAWDIDYIDYH